MQSMKTKNKEFFFDGNSVEYYTTENDGDGLIKLHFLSGHVVEVFSELDEDLYPGESVDTLVDKCICRYFKDKD